MDDPMDPAAAAANPAAYFASESVAPFSDPTLDPVLAGDDLEGANATPWTEDAMGQHTPTQFLLRICFGADLLGGWVSLKAEASLLSVHLLNYLTLEQLLKKRR